jgi:hypothetical protein
VRGERRGEEGAAQSRRVGGGDICGWRERRREGEVGEAADLEGGRGGGGSGSGGATKEEVAAAARKRRPDREGEGSRVSGWREGALAMYRRGNGLWWSADGKWASGLTLLCREPSKWLSVKILFYFFFKCI